ncbi:uncharacterized protein CLUP02_00163 [Colletotrichum lupini]|uniref:Uncharacterized protein n=1 Tax=Colletotrichum lupini TaxID=145971 RepID=A0A9Q8SAE9_9PEZI|nr:uncharacterized protein CLUP02_00163 [Colletotrichum lupini]UQC73518.1 hypothetical protein CLUP02_00163 [Colletotrichum lupini]
MDPIPPTALSAPPIIAQKSPSHINAQPILHSHFHALRYPFEPRKSACK